MSNRILVVTSCTGEKLHKPDNQLVLYDFKNKETLIQREKELQEYQETAGKMYTGSQQKALITGIQEYRQNGGQIDLCIVSAGYGVLAEDAKIVPYEVTFNTMDSQNIKKWAHHLKITEDLREKAKDYDLIFFLLGDKYLQAIEWPLDINEHQRAIFFAGGSSKARILNWDRYHVLAIGEKEAKEFKFGLIGIKGYLFAQLLKQVSVKNIDSSWNDIMESPEHLRDYILDSFSQNVEQLDMFIDRGHEKTLLHFYNELFPVPEHLIAKNFIEEPKFFIPENDDRVDPDYKFLTDSSEKNRNPLVNDKYAHEIFGKPQYDGLLVSKVNIDKATQQKREMMKDGMHKFYRLPTEYPIMGDCGAFSYIDKDEPPYTTEQIINYYHHLGFDYGVSVDHLVVGPFRKDKEIRDKRYELTLKRAEEFISIYKKNKAEKGYNFHPIGIAQGWNPISFRDAVERLIGFGYDYVALGGLAREQSENIYEILKAISPIIPSSTFRIHLFGVARDIRTMRSFHKLGVTSFDSSSPLRRAWLGTGHNYHTLTGKHYTAIRIPEAKETAGRVKQMIEKGNGEREFAEYKKLEQAALTALREFSAGKRELAATVDAILEYDKILGENREVHEELYTELLTERPWEHCECKICKKIGIDVVVFRGNNRNRRRGFHNTHVYYSQVQELKTQWKK